MYNRMILLTKLLIYWCAFMYWNKSYYYKDGDTVKNVWLGMLNHVILKILNDDSKMIQFYVGVRTLDCCLLFDPPLDTRKKSMAESLSLKI